MKKTIPVMLIMLFCACKVITPIAIPFPPPPPPAPAPVVMDTDKDGIPDDQDRCPNIPGVAKYQGCPIPDTDKDGIPDDEDRCPDVPGTKKNNGCPEVTMSTGEPNEPGPPPTGEPSPKPPIKPSPVPEKPKPGTGSVKPKPSPKPNRTPASEKPAIQPEAVNEKEEIVLKTAALGVSYHPKMSSDETADLMVFVDVSHPEGVVRTELRKIEQDQKKWVKKTDTSEIFTDQIEVYKKLSVTLLYDTTELTITPVNVIQRQELDLQKGNLWHWRVKVNAHKSSSKIIVKVDAETPDGALKKITPKEIEIKISINGWDAFLNGLYYLKDNPQYTIPSILVPLIIFLFKRRKKEEDKGKEPDADNA